MSLAGITYRLGTAALGPLVPLLLKRRAAKGKEDPKRLAERTARHFPTHPGAYGPMVWMHGASVGESLVNHTLAEALIDQRPDVRVLFTSHTQTSARLIAGKVALGPLLGRIGHAMAPVDTPAIARRFIAHWQPDLCLFAEGEIWPNLIREADASGAKLALFNARMTDRSLAGWGRVKGFARDVFGRFDAILASDARTAEGLARLTSSPVHLTGNVKGAAQPLTYDTLEHADLAAHLAGRPVWVAASTHPGEEEIALDAHAALPPGTLLALAPRHPERGDAVEALVRTRSMSLTRHSRGERPGPDTQVHLIDTMGRLGLWYRLGKGVYLGGGHAEGLGGHNPIEVVLCGAPVAAGRIIYNWEDIFLSLERHGAVRFVDTAGELAACVRQWLSGEAVLPDLADWKAELRRPLELTVETLLPLLPPMQEAMPDA